METKVISLNQQQWEKFAEADPYFYIDMLTENQEQFWRKGEENYAKYILPVLQKYSVLSGLAVDFGCGVGRHTFPLATYFSKTIGVDVSKQMVELAQSAAREKKMENVEFFQNDDFLLITNSIDFFFSINVFQHIEDFERIVSVFSYLADTLRGYAYVHFDTRPEGWMYCLKRLLPNFLLPRSQKRGIRRIRRDANDVRQMFQKFGFQIVEEQQPHSAFHFFLLKKG